MPNVNSRFQRGQMHKQIKSRSRAPSVDLKARHGAPVCPSSSSFSPTSSRPLALPPPLPPPPPSIPVIIDQTISFPRGDRETTRKGKKKQRNDNSLEKSLRLIPVTIAFSTHLSPRHIPSTREFLPSLFAASRQPSRRQQPPAAAAAAVTRKYTSLQSTERQLSISKAYKLPSKLRQV